MPDWQIHEPLLCLPFQGEGKIPAFSCFVLAMEHSYSYKMLKILLRVLFSKINGELR